MKTLLLLRHAKAENGAPGIADLNRALNERGKQEAQAIGRFIKKQNVKFQLVLCSTAVRAVETAALVLAAADAAATVHHDQRIYEAGPPQLLEVISEVKDEPTGVLLVGHNPALEELLKALTGRGEKMAPCTLAKIDLQLAAWSRMIEGKGSLEWILRPNNLVAD